MIYWIFFAIVVFIIYLLWSRKARGVAFLVPISKVDATPVYSAGLLQYYPPVEKEVKLDFPPKQIGCCPFSKPMSTGLPPADIPMCMAAAQPATPPLAAAPPPSN